MTKAPLITPVLIAGCVILMISFAIRASFGVFQIPIATEFGWLRADFSLAIAIQNPTPFRSSHGSARNKGKDGRI